MSKWFSSNEMVAQVYIIGELTICISPSRMTVRHRHTPLRSCARAQNDPYRAVQVLASAANQRELLQALATLADVDHASDGRCVLALNF
jgi:hypothetical protein